MHDLEDLFERQRVPVGPLGGQGVENIGDDQNSRFERQLGRSEAAMIAGTVQLFMVRGRNFTQLLKASDRSKDIPGVSRVFPQDLPFGSIQLSGLFENGIGDSHLAQVMQERRVADE